MFVWKVDRAGYDLADGGARIVRRGGELAEYRPAEVEPSLAYLFADLYGQIDAPGETHPRPRRVDGDPFWLRRFKNSPEALLEFAREFGFLGSLTAGADAESEAVEYLDRQHRLLATFYDFASDGSPQSQIKLFNANATPQMRLRLEEGEEGRPIASVEPQTLSGWFWVKIAEEISRGVSWAHCEWCRRPMARGGGRGARRAHVRFCSASCRALHHQSEKGTAR